MEGVQNIAFCPHCCNVAPQNLIFTQEYSARVITRLGDQDQSVTEVCFVAECASCKRLLLYKTLDGENINEEKNNFSEQILDFPESPYLDSFVPESVQERYIEARRIKDHAPNAFAVMIRRALEAICDDRGAKRGSLQTRLQDLVAKGDLPESLAKLTDILRLVGNRGAHADKSNVKWGHVNVIDMFFRAIVNYVYVTPNLVGYFHELLEREDVEAQNKELN